MTLGSTGLATSSSPRGHRGPGWLRLEFHAVIDFCQGELAINRSDVEAAVKTGLPNVFPVISGKTAVVLDPWVPLRDEDIIRKRGVLLIAGEFLTPIVGFGRVRENLDDHLRIDNDIAVLVVKARLSTNHQSIRVGKQPF